MKFMYVKPDTVRTHWRAVRAGLQSVLDKSPEEWIPEDVYAEVKANTALLFLAVEPNGDVVGGTVIRVNRPSLFVWAVWGESGLRAHGMDGLREIAHTTECTEILFETKRRGWERVAPMLGFRPRTWIAEV